MKNKNATNTNNNYNNNNKNKNKNLKNKNIRRNVKRPNKNNNKKYNLNNRTLIFSKGQNLNNYKITLSKNPTNLLSYKLKCIYDPFFASQNGTIFSIFGTDDKIIKTTNYTVYQITIPANTTVRMLFIPNSVGFKSLIDNQKLQYYVPDIQNGELCTAFCNLYMNYEGQSNISMRPATLSNITGRYRIISSSININNVTNVTNKSGTYLAATGSLGSVCPSYYAPSRISVLPNNSYHGYDPLNEAFAHQWESMNNKILVPATSAMKTHWMNLNKGNIIFSDSIEFQQSQFASINNGDVLGDCALNCYPFEKRVVGNVDVFFFKFYSVATTQNYVFEVMSTLEVLPDPGSNLGSISIVNNKPVGDYTRDLLSKLPNFTVSNTIV